MNRPCILFVDDEPHILNGYRDLLWKERKQWDMAFACGGAQALTEMERKPYAVVISDMQMPRMDGSELLKEVSERHPNVVRLLLTGEASRDAILRSMPVAHEFLSKPCSSVALRSAIERACKHIGNELEGRFP